MQIAAVHREDVVSGFDVHAGLRQRRFASGIPVLAVIDFRNAVTAILKAVVRAEKTSL